MRFSHVASAALLLVMTLTRLQAQTATGEVGGTVTDSLGAIVAGANVRLVNQATGIETTRLTGESGGYVFVNVQPGVYSLRVTMAGFKEAEVSRFPVAVNQAVLLNVKL